MRIPCPHCGDRSIDEFVQLGAVPTERPAAGAPLQDFVDYVYFRTNPAGRHDELFQHVGGCRAMLRVCRDTRNHEVLSVRSVASFADAGERA